MFWSFIKFSTHISLRKYIEISLENLYEDIGAQRVKCHLKYWFIIPGKRLKGERIIKCLYLYLTYINCLTESLVAWCICLRSHHTLAEDRKEPLSFHELTHTAVDSYIFRQNPDKLVGMATWVGQLLQCILEDTKSKGSDYCAVNKIAEEEGVYRGVVLYNLGTVCQIGL